MNTSDHPEERPFRLYDAASIGAALKHYRTEAGLSQAELANQAGVSRSYLSRVEGGLETEYLAALFRLLGTLGVRGSLRREEW